MTDRENLQKQERQDEAAQDLQYIEIMKQITELFQQLSPTARLDLLEVLGEDLDDDLTEEDDA